MYSVYLLFEGAGVEGPRGGVGDLVGIYRSLEDAQDASDTKRSDWAEILEIVAARPGRLWRRLARTRPRGTRLDWWALDADPWRPGEV